MRKNKESKEKRDKFIRIVITTCIAVIFFIIFMSILGG